MPEPDRTPVLAGGCQCGAIRYCLYSQPIGTICHCRMCQKAVGGPFAAFAALPRGDLAWTHGRPATFRSSSLAERGFCAVCGTPLTYDGVGSANIDITICSLDTPRLFPRRTSTALKAPCPGSPASPPCPRGTPKPNTLASPATNTPTRRVDGAGLRGCPVAALKGSPPGWINQDTPSWALPGG
jgi:hypothetical protein